MPEHPAAPAAHNFKSVKDVELSAKTRMDKSIADMQHTIASIRTGRASVSVFEGPSKTSPSLIGSTFLVVNVIGIVL